jgi:hypothetical protein
MSRKFLTAIDLSKNSLNNAQIQNLSSAPSSPVSGQIYFDTTLNEFGVYNGSGWVYLGSGGGTVTAVSVASANGFSGTVANASTTPAITIQTSITGIVKGNGTAISAAVSGTDYAPATSGSSALKGNGSGGFSTATINDLGSQTADYSANSHKITNLTDPTNPQDAATKNYVDVTAQGLQIKPTATVATTGALPAGTYSNGTSGVGATFTVTATGTTTVDGHVLAASDLVLVMNQASAFQNGLYVVTTAGTTGVSTVLTRHTDMDQAAEFSGAFVPVGNTGTTNANSLWLANPSGAVTVGTTSIPFTQLNGATDLIPGTGLSISGNTVSLSTPVSAANGGLGVGGVTGLIKGNGTSAATAAVSGTDYAPATSGSLILKGNGSGGFSSAKFTATIGDGSTTSIAVTDGLGTIDKVAIVRDATTGAQVECDITYSSTQVTFGFATAPASNAYKVVIVG